MATYENIFDAVQKGTIEDVKHFLEAKGADINLKDNRGYTPLLVAASRENVEVVKFLIQKGADVNAEDNNGYTALHRAVWQKEVEVAKILLSVDGIKVNTFCNAERSRDGTFRRSTPLHEAVFNDDVELAYLLVSKGAKVDAKDDGGDTPLDMAELRSPAMRDCLSGKGMRLMTLEDELREIEATVNKCEKELRDGTICENYWIRQMEDICVKIYGKKFPDPTNAAKAPEFAKAIGEAQKKLFDMAVVNRLAILTGQHPDNSRISELGSKALKCYLKVSEIVLSAMEVPNKEEQLNGIKIMFSTAGLRIE